MDTVPLRQTCKTSAPGKKTVVLPSAPPLNVLFDGSPGLRAESPAQPGITFRSCRPASPRLKKLISPCPPPPPAAVRLHQPYMAPEVLNDGMPRTGYNESVDMWAVGVVLHELLTGRTPFRWVSSPFRF